MKAINKTRERIKTNYNRSNKYTQTTRQSRKSHIEVLKIIGREPFDKELDIEQVRAMTIEQGIQDQMRIAFSINKSLIASRTWKQYKSLTTKNKNNTSNN